MSDTSLCSACPVLLLLAVCFFLVSACSTTSLEVDVLIRGAKVYDGTNTPARALEIGICEKHICLVQESGDKPVAAGQTIDASGLVVAPGFIDPHTHSFEELASQDKHSNQNYLFQGVTTVVNGNDGDGPADIGAALGQLNPQGIGTNLALYAGHGSIRQAVLGKAQRQANAAELAQMQQLVDKAMQDGALGLSSGLYYVPGRFANSRELIVLAKVAAQYGGIYDTHIRDESSFNIGFLAAVDEAIEIARESGIHLHLAHIKALGVDVWGQSLDAIKKVEQAQQAGISISADQYPWLASGTNIRSAIVPKWAMADSEQAFLGRLDNPDFSDRLKHQIADNIRRRGGADKLLITASTQQNWVGQSLQELADLWQLSPVEATLKMVRMGRHRVASYNMHPEDIERFMQRPWVVTSSDGTDGHPRKYASFPRKYRHYVVEQKLLTTQQFIHNSSGRTAEILGLKDRGFIREGMAADILLFDPKQFRHKASFEHWDQLSKGVVHLFVNGQATIFNKVYTGALAGEFVKPGGP